MNSYKRNTKNFMLYLVPAIILLFGACTSNANAGGKTEEPSTDTAKETKPLNISIRFSELTEKEQSVYFSDLDESTVEINAFVDFLFEKGILQDDDNDGLYHPSANLKRCDLAVMLYRIYNYSVEGISYGDVNTNEYYYDAVMRGKAGGVFEDTKYFNADAPVTWEQAALWIYRSELLNGLPEQMISADVSSYYDCSDLSEESKNAIGTLTRLRIFSIGDSFQMGEPAPEGMGPGAPGEMNPGGPGAPKMSGPGNGNERGGSGGMPPGEMGPGGNNSRKTDFNPDKIITNAEIAKIIYNISTHMMNAPGGPGIQSGLNSSVDHGTYANIADADASGVTYTSTGDAENALRIEGDVNIVLEDITVNKTAGTAGTGDSSNFYGSNAGILTINGAAVEINNSSVNTDTDGANGIFSYGPDTDVTINNTTIRTSMNSSGGVMVTGGGNMTVNNSDIETRGNSSAALRTDRGGGFLTVDGGQYKANGEGSPAIYSTADVKVKNATLTATASEAVVVEGKNSVALNNCTVSGNMHKDNVENLQNVMIYQSMSGDAETGKSSFTMEGGSLTSNNGDMFYVTNTSCTIYLKDVELNLSNTTLLKVAGNDARNGWGVAGKNGGNCEMTVESQALTGNIIVDQISSLNLSLTDNSYFTGTINTENRGGSVSVEIDETSKWELSGDVYLSQLYGSIENIITNGHKLYVNGIEI